MLVICSAAVARGQTPPKSDTERLRAIATSTLEKSSDDAKIKNAAELLKLASEIDQTRADANKLKVEEEKISHDLEESRRPPKSDDAKAYIVLLGPLVTTLVLAGTLIFQIYQFRKTEQDRREETKSQAAAAEDVRWTDAVKLLAHSDKIPPGALLLKSFAGSERYREQAYRTAVQILIKTEDPGAFTNLFGSIFDPIDQNNAAEVYDLNRILTSSFNSLQDKVWNPEKKKNELENLSETDQVKYKSLDAELGFISIKLAATLKGARQAGAALDLHAMSFWSADLRGVDLKGADLSAANLSAADLRGSDLSGANLNETTLYTVNIKEANLSGITEYRNVSLLDTAWWQVSQISQNLLQYLIEAFPFDPNVIYPGHQSFSKSDYDAEIARLRQSISKS